MPKQRNMIVFDKQASPQEIYEAVMAGLELDEPLPESEPASDACASQESRPHKAQAEA